MMGRVWRMVNTHSGLPMMGRVWRMVNTHSGLPMMGRVWQMVNTFRIANDGQRRANGQHTVRITHDKQGRANGQHTVRIAQWNVEGVWLKNTELQYFLKHFLSCIQETHTCKAPTAASYRATGGFDKTKKSDQREDC